MEVKSLSFCTSGFWWNDGYLTIAFLHSGAHRHKTPLWKSLSKPIFRGVWALICLANFILACNATFVFSFKVTVYLQGCFAYRRCSKSDLNCRYLNPYIKLELIGLAIRLYQTFWKKWNVEFFTTCKCTLITFWTLRQSEFCFSLIECVPQFPDPKR